MQGTELPESRHAGIPAFTHQIGHENDSVFKYRKSHRDYPAAAVIVVSFHHRNVTSVEPVVFNNVEIVGAGVQNRTFALSLESVERLQHSSERLFSIG